VLRGDDREREFALEFGEGLLLSAAAADEVIQGGQGERQVGGDGVVLEVPVIRGEQIELEILGALVARALLRAGSLALVADCRQHCTLHKIPARPRDSYPAPGS